MSAASPDIRVDESTSRASDARLTSPLVRYGASEHILDRWGAQLEPVMTEQEQRRAAALRRPQDQMDFTAARVLARVVVADLTGAGAETVMVHQHCSMCGRAHGRPSIAGYTGVHVSFSHAAGAVAAVAGYCSVGIDADAQDNVHVNDLLAANAFAPAEVKILRDLEQRGTARAQCDASVKLAALRLWVRKEALVKVGAVSLDGFGQLDLSALPFDNCAEPIDPISSTFGDWMFLDWRDPDMRMCFSVASRTTPILLPT